MIFGRSLRTRLSVLILVPLVLVSIATTYWRFENARRTAEEIFDNKLVMLCLAVSRDVASSGGDTLSATTANLFKGASGGDVFYHVYGPDGSFVTGYSSPPIRAADQVLTQNEPLLFDAIYQGDPVRAVSLAERVEIDGFAGVSVVTVWQQLEPRAALAWQLAIQAAVLALILVMTVATLVIFGVRLGLRPLDQLEKAIQKRSLMDLSPISRQIPVEAQGIVARLNSLFGTLTDAQTAQERLISNAAHQLRNPVAAIHALAQATLAAKTFEDSKDRATQLVAETRQAMRLTQQMLSFERIKGAPPKLVTGDINLFVQELATRIGPEVLKANIGFELICAEGPLYARHDPLLLGEAITNLVNNAQRHASPSLTIIRIQTGQVGHTITISVSDDGAAVDPDLGPQIFERFKQGTDSTGSGLGLAIVHEVARLHGGAVSLETAPLTRFEISLPAAD